MTGDSEGMLIIYPDGHLFKIIPTSEQLYPRGRCGEDFIQNSELMCHQRDHLKEKACRCEHRGRGFSCSELCGRGFTRPTCIKQSTWMRNRTNVTSAGRASPGAQVCLSIIQSIQVRNLSSVTGVRRASVRAQSCTSTRESTLERSRMNVRSAV